MMSAKHSSKNTIYSYKIRIFKKLTYFYKSVIRLYKMIKIFKID